MDPSQAARPTLLQVVDALILYDAPLLDRRFQEAIAMHPDAGVRAQLAALPGRVAEGARMTRRAGVEWERVTQGSDLETEFRQRAERYLLEAYLDAAEAQIRLKTFMALHAPTRDVRQLIDGAIAVHRELTSALRAALKTVEPGRPPQRPTGALVGTAREEGDLRGELEAALRRAREGGNRPRVLAVSANALRRLRDQGLFRGGDASIDGVPVQVEFAWQGFTFALMTMESEALEEILATVPAGTQG